MHLNPRYIILPALLLTGFGAGDVTAQTLRGSRDAVERAHRQAVDHDLTFYRTGPAVRAAESEGALVRLSPNADYRIHEVSHPYVLPTTRTFVTRLASQYRVACGEQLVVTSAVRPTSLRLANGVDKSVHPAGMAIDIRRPNRGSCAKWLRETLLAVEGRGVIDATEERYPPHFHIAVFPRLYLAYLGRSPAMRPATRDPATVKAGARSYEVRRGDTLWSIARRHRTSVDDLKAANRMRSTRIVAGQRLVIPTR